MSVILKILLMYCLVHFNPLYLTREESMGQLESDLVEYFHLQSSDYQLMDFDQNKKHFHFKKVIEIKRKISTTDYNAFFLSEGYKVASNSSDSQLLYEKNNTFYDNQIYLSGETIRIISMPSQYESILIALVSLGTFIWIFWRGILRRLGVRNKDQSLKPH